MPAFDCHHLDYFVAFGAEETLIAYWCSVEEIPFQFKSRSAVKTVLHSEMSLFRVAVMGGPPGSWIRLFSLYFINRYLCIQSV